MAREPRPSPDSSMDEVGAESNRLGGEFVTPPIKACGQKKKPNPVAKQGMRKNLLPNGNDAFVCEYCNCSVSPLTFGSYRNHCPFCLYSKHVDIVPGDRNEACHGLMQPIGVDYSSKKGWIIIHKCDKCHIVRRNKAALNGEMSDDYEVIVKLASFQ